MAGSSRARLHLGTAAAGDAGRRAGRAGSAIMWMAAVVLAGCTSVGRTSRPTEEIPLAPPPTLTATTTAPMGRIGEELDRLEAFPDHPGARLRTAWLLQEQGDWKGASTILNGLLFGDLPHGPEVEAVARYLRGRAFLHDRDRDRAEHEWSEALALSHDPALRARIGENPAAAPRRSARASETPAILPRSAWQAASARARSMRRMPSVRRVTVHHSATMVRSTDRAVAARMIRGIQRHHQGHNGWGDIGYHFLIDPAGRIWAGRTIQWQGAHAGDNARNEANIGICLLGNFVRSAQGAPPPVQLRALEQLLASLSSRYHIDPRHIYTHQELKTTACPGPYVQIAVERMRERLADSMHAEAAASR